MFFVRSNRFVYCCAVLISHGALLSTESAATNVYTIDSAQSIIHIVPSTFDTETFAIVDGTKFLNRYGIYAQKGPTAQLLGSLDGRVSGSLSADVSGTTFTFVGQNKIDVALHAQAPFLP